LTIGNFGSELGAAEPTHNGAHQARGKFRSFSGDPYAEWCNIDLSKVVLDR
jgi:hypothetical protein